ncbi:unnamed protein product [Bathycoccus prasinos]
MTFINRRIIKRPTLFATSRRNFGNLLTHYETGQDGTTPDPDPTPDPVAFTTSWSINGGIVEANLTGISSHRTTEVIVLTRDDGTVLATLDENKVGDWDLQRDEGTTYGSYTYNVRLDGVIKSTFSRDYQPNVPSFSTNFFSNIAKRISCGVENISNPHDSYSVRLARPDDTILDTQVLNDATPFFLQFTESDYGTYDYKLLLSKWTTTSTSNPNIPPESYWVDTVIATHQQIFVRPEPTFTTSWTKSGLTINADLSSITGAHPDFYAYLCRDDGTTLATHHFQTGQTASLSFTETEYGSYNYQLKLGTVVKSSHTETYVRPTPTYTTSFSTNELTLTASITSITNAHNSFAITLERDDGTELSTHTLADGETSFTFTQTETSYATFNYVVKINGTQTDTYSATYTPPPTPTFDIALTNTDLAITATLTNIVNPDPYYTLMIHDANDTHLDGHTFATGDTTATLSWTETSYGEKIYTKLLNGASIGTETITLTEPNTSFTFPEVGTFIYFDEATWGTNFRLKLLYADVSGYDQWAYYRHDPQTTYTANGIRVERSTGIWTDWGNEAPNTVNNDTPTVGKIQFENQYNQVYTFTNPYPTSTSTTTFNPPSSYTLTGPPSGGYYPDFTVNYDVSKQTGTKYYYGIGGHSGGVFSGYYFYWDSSNNTWNDAQGNDGTADPVSFSYSATPVVNGTVITGIGGQGADFIFTMSGIPIRPGLLLGTLQTHLYPMAELWKSPTTERIDFATHATISATAVANSIAIGYYDFGAWVNGWSFPNTYTSGDVPASAISGNWASSFVSMIEQGSSSTPTVVSPLPVLSQHTQAFGMEYYQTVGTKYYYKSDSHTGTGTSITYDYETKTWNDEGSQVPYHLNTTSTFASTTSLVNPAEIHGFGSQQNHNGTRYFSVSNPYYEA